MSNSPVIETAALPWYEDPHKLQEKRIELGVSVARLAKAAGRHRSYVELVESGAVPLKWESVGETLWSYLTEVQLNQGKTTPLSRALEAPHGKRSREDLLDEIKQLREVRRLQQEQITNLKESSGCWDELASTRAEVIRTLRIELGENPDEDEEL